VRDAFGQNGHHVYRPDRPRQNDAGKLWHTEGARKVDSLLSVSVLAIGLSGVYGFRGRNPQGARRSSPTGKRSRSTARISSASTPMLRRTSMSGLPSRTAGAPAEGGTDGLNIKMPSTALAGRRGRCAPSC
jgi:hypothetical protein